MDGNIVCFKFKNLLMNLFSEVIIPVAIPVIIPLITFLFSNKSKSREYFEDKFDKNAIVSKVNLSFSDNAVCFNVNYKNFENGFVFGRYKYSCNKLTHVGSEKIFFRIDHYVAYIDLDTISILKGGNPLIYMKDLKYCGILNYLNYYIGYILTPSRVAGEFMFRYFYFLYGLLLTILILFFFRTGFGLNITGTVHYFLNNHTL